MTKNTSFSIPDEMGCIELIVKAWNKVKNDSANPTSKEYAKALSEEISTNENVARGLINGMQNLFDYAQKAQLESTTALEEERQSVVVAFSSIRPLYEARLQNRVDEEDERQERVKCDKCGGICKSEGRRKRKWKSTVGVIQIKRRYSLCEKSREGKAESERLVGLPNGEYTAALEETATMMATTVPYAMAVKLISQMMNIELSEQGLKTASEKRAEQVIKIEMAEAEEVKEYEEKWEKHPPYITEQVPKQAIEVAYLEVDGVYVMTRTEIENQAKQKAGRGGPGRKYEVGGREIKNAILYKASDCAKESENRGCLLNKTYISHMGEWLGLAMLIWVQILKLGFNRAGKLVVLSDGAKWIRSLCQWLPMQVFFILDLYHVKHKVWELAAILFGENTPQSLQWANIQCERIEQGHTDDVIEVLKSLSKVHSKQRDQISALQTYLENNIDRMDYPTYKAEGLRVGSGAIESANYHVTGARLKLQGMRWSPDGAAQMAALRADLFNNRWSDRSRQLLMAT